MTMGAIIARRSNAILTQWRLDPLLQVQIEHPTALANFQFLAAEGGAGAVDPLGRRAVTNAGVWRRPGDPDANASLWVRAGYDSYRGAYLAFVREVYGLTATLSDLAGYDVDHLLNRARSPLDSTFIRLEAVPTAVNQRWGALFERFASDPNFFANQRRERRTMSWMIASKLAGQMPPNGPDDTAGIQRLVAFWVSRGFSAQEAENGLRSMLNFAYGRGLG